MQVLNFFFCLNFFEGTKYSSYQWCLKQYKETETEARIIGVQTQMNKFNYFLESNQLFFYYDIVIILVKLCKARNSASQAQSITRETVITLEKLRDDDYFLLFWKEILTESKQLDIDAPALERKRKASRRIFDMVLFSLTCSSSKSCFLNQMMIKNTKIH